MMIDTKKKKRKGSDPQQVDNRSNENVMVTERLAGISSKHSS